LLVGLAGAEEMTGQRQCLQFLTANLIKPASGGHP